MSIEVIRRSQYYDPVIKGKYRILDLMWHNE